MTMAQRLTDLVNATLPAPLPVRIRAWDGSEAGPRDAAVLVLRANALRRLIWRPGELGLAQAYIMGDIDVDGDLAEVLPLVWRTMGGQARAPRIGLGTLASAVRMAVSQRLLWPRPPALDMEAALSGRTHSRQRDRDAIEHHYDLSNEFYELILDPRMVYSCGYWTSREPGYDLESAQVDKLDLVCRKLGIADDTRLLDVGCGWGALAIHAASHYGARVVGVTLSRRQHEFAIDRVAQMGLPGRVELRLVDYRDIDDGPYDAISTIEMGEHVGEHGYPGFAAKLRSLLAPCGRLLVQQMSRGGDKPGGGAFIEKYIAPDMHMRPIGQTVDAWERAGFEIRDVQAMREHYVRTVRHWLTTLEERWDEAVAMVGEPTARVWRLYLVGGALAFEDNRMGVDQVLAVATTDTGRAGMSDTPHWAPAVEVR